MENNYRLGSFRPSNARSKFLHANAKSPRRLKGSNPRPQSTKSKRLEALGPRTAVFDIIYNIIIYIYNDVQVSRRKGGGGKSAYWLLACRRGGVLKAALDYQRHNTLVRCFPSYSSPTPHAAANCNHHRRHHHHHHRAVTTTTTAATPPPPSQHHSHHRD